MYMFVGFDFSYFILASWYCFYTAMQSYSTSFYRFDDTLISLYFSLLCTEKLHYKCSRLYTSNTGDQGGNVVHIQYAQCKSSLLDGRICNCQIKISTKMLLDIEIIHIGIYIWYGICGIRILYTYLANTLSVHCSKS